MSAPSQPAAPSEKRPRFYLLGAVLLAVLILAPSLLYPFGRDQAVFAYVGSVIARGGMPFRDAWDLKPPGIYALYGLLAALAPDHGFGLMALLRVVDVGSAAATAALLALLARRWGYPEAGWASGAWYAALYLQGGFWSLAQAEAFANPLLVGAALLCLAGDQCPREDGAGLRVRLRLRSRAVLYGLAGLLTGLAAVLKFTTVLPVLVFLTWAVWRGGKSRWVSLAAFAVGGAVSVGAAVLWLQAGGALEAYLDIQRGFVAPYTRLNAAGPLDRLAACFWGVGRWALQVCLPLLLALAWLPRRGSDGERPARMLGWGALLAAVAAVAVQNKFFLYHWETALPWLALLGGIGAAVLLRRLRLTGPRAAAVTLALPLAWSLAGRWSAYRDGALYVAGALPRERWLQRFTSRDRDYSFQADTEAAAYLRQHTRPGDRVLIWGFEPAVHLLSDRPSPTRFFFNVPVAVPYTPAAWKTEFLTDLRQDTPELFLVLRNDAIPWANGLKEDSTGQLRNWPELSRFLDHRYRLEAQIEDFSIYRLRRGEK